MSKSLAVKRTKTKSKKRRATETASLLFMKRILFGQRAPFAWRSGGLAVSLSCNWKVEHMAQIVFSLPGEMDAWPNTRYAWAFVQAWNHLGQTEPASQEHAPEVWVCVTTCNGSRRILVASSRPCMSVLVSTFVSFSGAGQK